MARRIADEAVLGNAIAVGAEVAGSGHLFVRENLRAVSTFVAVTVAPGMTAPLVSCNVPLSDPWSICAWSRAGQTTDAVSGFREFEDDSDASNPKTFIFA